MKTIRITGIANYDKIDKYFASRMVDIGYIGKLENGIAEIYLDQESAINLGKEEDKSWLMELIQQALDECDENNAKVEIIDN